MGKIICQRIYNHEDSVPCRILIDRIWPRGISREEAHIQRWEKEVAPSNELRKWFGHLPDRYEEFARRYRQELDSNPDAEQFVQFCRETLPGQDICLLYGARDQQRNNAVVLQEWLRERLQG